MLRLPVRANRRLTASTRTGSGLGLCRSAPVAYAPLQRRVFCSATKSAPRELSLAASLATGGLAGVLSAMSGVGGGMIIIPTLAKLTTMQMQKVNATSLLGLSGCAVVGAWNYADAGVCNYPLAAVSALPAILFSRVGVQFAHKLSSNHLAKIVGIGMLLSAPIVALKGTDFANDLVQKWKGGSSSSFTSIDKTNSLDLQYFGSHAGVHHKKDANNSRETVIPLAMTVERSLWEEVAQDPLGFVRANLRYVMVSSFAGFISGLCGIGGGIITTTYLTTATELPQSAVVGTTLVSVLPMVMATNYHNYRANAIHFPTAVKLGSSLAVSVYFTSKYILTHEVPDELLRGVLAVTISAAAIATIRRPI